VTFSRALRRRLAPFLALAALSASNVAWAGPAPERNAAELLDAQATSLMQEHRYAEACPKLAESDRLEPGTGVLLRLALCYELSGKTASAWSAFREAAARAQRAGDESLRQLATKRAVALEPQVTKMIIHAAPGTENEQVDVRCDGAPLDRAALGAEIPLDPGLHTVQAALPGRKTFVRTFTVAARDALLTIAIDLPLESTGAVTPSAAPPPNAESTGAVQREAGLIVGGVGLAGVVAGSIFGLIAMSNWNRARSECTNGTSGCSQDALNLQPAANEDALWSTVGFIGGAAGLVGGVLLWATAPKGTGHVACTVAPVVGGDRVGVEMMGRF
jgi:hypothetical protein